MEVWFLHSQTPGFDRGNRPIVRRDLPHHIVRKGWNPDSQPFFWQPSVCHIGKTLCITEPFPFPLFTFDYLWLVRHVWEPWTICQPPKCIQNQQSYLFFVTELWGPLGSPFPAGSTASHNLWQMILKHVLGVEANTQNISTMALTCDSSSAVALKSG